MDKITIKLPQQNLSSLSERLKEIHNTILERLPGISRIACVLYDSNTDLLKTFINSSHSGHNIEKYEYPLSKSYELYHLKKNNSCRIISNISEQNMTNTEHAKWLSQQNYRSSFTVPMFHAHRFYGFIFLDSHQLDYFDEQKQQELLLFTQLITLTISTEIHTIQTLLATAKAAKEFSGLRDFETGMHLNRMALLSRLIARSLAEKYHFTDEEIEYIYLFSPLHDIGKIGIPDRILLKPGKFNSDEYALMKEHVNKGVQIIKKVLDDYQLSELHYSKIMLNIIAYHHEYLDGSGYPNGISGDTLPIEAKITTVADIFDALTSTRPYKKPIPIDTSLEMLKAMVDDGKLDSECVGALIENINEATEIITKFRD